MQNDTILPNVVVSDFHTTLNTQQLITRFKPHKNAHNSYKCNNV